MNDKKITILVVDDDEEDVLLIKKAFEKASIIHRKIFLRDGQDLIDFLLKQGEHSESTETLPNLIILDLNMPRKNGIEALKEIKSNYELQHIPIIMFTTSKKESDIQESYVFGANSFVSKPIDFEELIEKIRGIDDYWTDIATLP